MSNRKGSKPDRINKPAFTKNWPKELLTRYQVPLTRGLIPWNHPIEVKVGRKIITMPYEEMLTAKHWGRKLDLLWCHYGCDPADKTKKTTRTILFNVLRDWVPGFQKTFHSPAGGRPQVWNDQNLRALRERVDDCKKKNPRLSALRACGLLCKNVDRYKRYSPNSLRRQYFEARKRIRNQPTKG